MKCWRSEITISVAAVRSECRQMLAGGTTLLFVSHNIQTVKNLCDNAIWLDKGVVRMAGPSELVCTAYKEEQDRIAKEKKEEKRRKLREAKKPYDYLIVGAGLYGAVFASEMTKKGKRCLVIDKRDHIGGNVYTKDVDGIQVHQYGAHIFHTSDKQVWNYVNKLTEFNNYINSPVAVYKDELYNLPFNMNTFSRLWNLRTPKEVQAKIAGTDRRSAYYRTAKSGGAGAFPGREPMCMRS